MFKESLRNTYVGYLIGKNNIKVSKSTTIEWIDELSYSDFIITNENKFNTFKHSGSSNSLDGSEGYQFWE